MNTSIFRPARILPRIIAPLTLMVALLFSACTSDPQTEALLQRADSLMESHPDSAYRLLDSIAPYMVGKSEALRMRHQLLSAHAQNKLYIPFTTDSIMKVVADYYDHHGTSNERMLAHHLLGCTYRDMKDYPAALSCLYDAIECADTLNTDCNHIYLSNIYIQMYELLYSQYMQTKALEALHQSRRHAEMAGDSYRASLCVYFMTRVYSALGDTARMLKTSREARKLLLAENRHQEAARTYNSDIFAAVERGDYASARTMMNVYETESGLFDDKGYIQKGFEKYYYIKGMYYLGLNRTDSAEVYFRKLDNTGYILDAQKGLLELFKRKRETDSIVKYSTLYEKSLDDWINNMKNESVGKVVASHNYTRHKNLAVVKENEANKTHFHNMLLLFALLSAVIICAIGILIYRWKKSTEAKHLLKEYRKLTNEKKKLEEELETVNEVYLRNEGVIMMLKRINDMVTGHPEDNSNVQQEVIKLLTQEVENNRISQRDFVQTKETEIETLNSIILEYKKRLSRLQAKDSVEEADEILKLKEKAKNPQSQEITETDWKQLYNKMLTPNSKIETLLNTSDDLSEHEKKTLFLVLIGMSNKEICNILGTTPQNVTNWKKGANKKLFSDESAKTLQKNLNNP